MFNLTNEIIESISKTFNVKKEEILFIAEHYKQVQIGQQEEYLSHLIRTMEHQLQELTGNKLFKIFVEPLPMQDNSFIAKAHYEKGRAFVILYPEKLDEKQARVLLAHELGHLYLIEYLNNMNKERNYTQKTNTEPLSTVFGILAILDKNNFYHTVANKKHLHKDWQEIIDDFSLLENRVKNLLNISN